MSRVARPAIRLYEAFHQFAPRDIGSFDVEFRIPSAGIHIGWAEQMLYRSDKLNPETGEDEGCIDYVHDHGPNVCVLFFSSRAVGPVAPVPPWLRNEQALVRLGLCLGFQFRTHEGELATARVTEPLPEWYAANSGRALLLVHERRELEAVFVGGDLEVTWRGVVG